VTTHINILLLPAESTVGGTESAINWDGEIQGIAALNDKSVDANDSAATIEQRAAAIARINRRVRLYTVVPGLLT